MPDSNELNPIERLIWRKECEMFLKKYWPHIVAVLAVAEPFLEPSLKVYIAAHPHAALGILVSTAIALYHKTPPQQQ